VHLSDNGQIVHVPRGVSHGPRALEAVTRDQALQKNCRLRRSWASDSEHSKTVILRGARVRPTRGRLPARNRRVGRFVLRGPSVVRLFFNKTLFLVIESTGGSRAKKRQPDEGLPLSDSSWSLPPYRGSIASQFDKQ
jgi:hypothetical protein